jgi:hypothetical protein
MKRQDFVPDCVVESGPAFLQGSSRDHAGVDERHRQGPLEASKKRKRNAFVAIDGYGDMQLNLWRHGGVWWRRAVPDPLSKAQRYRERAAECRRLASLATSAETQREYEELAGHYEELARAEATLAERANKAI